MPLPLNNGMRTKTLFILSWLLASTAAFGQSNSTGHATIVVLADSSVGEMMYLMRFHAPGLDYDHVDSAIVKDKTVLFTFDPDPMKEYQIRLGQNYIAEGIYLAKSDSIVFKYSPSDIGIIFDRIGAIQFFHDSSNRPRSQWDFYNDMGIQDWDGMCAYSMKCLSRMEKCEPKLKLRYPEHPGLLDALHDVLFRWYYEPRLSYFDKYMMSDTAIDAIDTSHLAFLNSIPWRDTSLMRGSELENLVSSWLQIETWRWWKDGRDTAGKTFYDREIEFGFSLPAPARDVAILNVIKNLGMQSPEMAVRLAEKVLAKYRALATASDYTFACEKKLAEFRSRLPGKVAPTFSLPDTSHKIVSLSDFHGKIVYLDFWGTWCEPCLEELTALIDLQKKFEHDTSVAFVGIALEGGVDDQSVKEWSKFVLSKELHGTQLYAANQFQNEAAVRYGIQGVPTFMLIDRKGNFIDAAAPRPSSGKAEDAIRAALSKSD